MTFFAGNSKLLLVKKQVDKDTAITDFSTATALRVYEFTRNPARTITELEESDASEQQGASHVSAIGPGFSFGVYGRPSELDLLADGLLGDTDNSATSAPTTHTTVPAADTPYYSFLDVLPYGTVRYDGCRFGAAQFQAQDEGQTELRVTGINVIALGVTHAVTAPDPLPTPVDELPFIYAEAAVSYHGAHPGITKSFTWTINRNLARDQGDAGFRATDATNRKLQTDGSFTRYTQDDTLLRAVDTGTTGGTDATAIVFTESASVLFTRGSGGTLRSFLIAAPEVSYQSREEALNLDGSPYAEVLPFRTEPQATLAEHISIVTVNGKTTP